MLTAVQKQKLLMWFDSLNNQQREAFMRWVECDDLSFIHRLIRRGDDKFNELLPILTVEGVNDLSP